jgi:hypothetical protein
VVTKSPCSSTCGLPSVPRAAACVRGASRVGDARAPAGADAFWELSGRGGSTPPPVPDDLVFPPLGGGGGFFAPAGATPHRAGCMHCRSAPHPRSARRPPRQGAAQGAQIRICASFRVRFHPTGRHPAPPRPGATFARPVARRARRWRGWRAASSHELYAVATSPPGTARVKPVGGLLAESAAQTRRDAGKAFARTLRRSGAASSHGRSRSPVARRGRGRDPPRRESDVGHRRREMSVARLAGSRRSPASSRARVHDVERSTPRPRSPRRRRRTSFPSTPTFIPRNVRAKRVPLSRASRRSCSSCDRRRIRSVASALAANPRFPSEARVCAVPHSVCAALSWLLRKPAQQVAVKRENDHTRGRRRST